MAACNNTESERRLFSIWTLYQQRAREEHFLLLSLSLLLAADPARGKSNNTKVRKRKSATAARIHKEGSCAKGWLNSAEYKRWNWNICFPAQTARLKTGEIFLYCLSRRDLGSQRTSIKFGKGVFFFHLGRVALIFPTTLANNMKYSCQSGRRGRWRKKKSPG
jgi:hypothetical protein